MSHHKTLGLSCVGYAKPTSFPARCPELLSLEDRTIITISGQATDIVARLDALCKGLCWDVDTVVATGSTPKGMSVFKFLTKVGWDEKDIQKLQTSLKDYCRQLVLSCRHKDILRCSITPHFKSCYRLDTGSFRHVPYELLANANIAIAGIKDRAGNWLARCFIQWNPADSTITPGRIYPCGKIISSTIPLNHNTTTPFDT